MQVTQLEEKNVNALEQLQRHEQLTSELQLGLLKKHARINELLLKNKQLVSEFVRYNVELKNKDSKVETVRLLAEAATVVETEKNNNSSKRAREIILIAEQYLAEGIEELKENNFEGASYLAYQALDIVQTLHSRENNTGQQGEEKEVTFILHLPMKVLRKSNVREEPTKQARILGVEREGDIISAVGFRGHWVKVENREYGIGWIHYSLLGGLNN